MKAKNKAQLTIDFESLATVQDSNIVYHSFVQNQQNENNQVKIVSIDSKQYLYRSILKRGSK